MAPAASAATAPLLRACIINGPPPLRGSIDGGAMQIWNAGKVGLRAASPAASFWPSNFGFMNEINRSTNHLATTAAPSDPGAVTVGHPSLAPGPRLIGRLG
jgi:hypothetical protein